MLSSISIKTKKWEILFFLFIACVCFAFNHSVSLWDQDEAAYAGFAKNMLETGNWLIPDFMWSDIHRKPPLHFWSIAIFYKLFGINEFSVRLPATLSILGTYLCLFFWGGKWLGRKIAFLSTVVLSTSLFIPVLAKVSVTDAGLLFYSTIAAFSLIEILENKRNWAVLSFWIAISLGVLLKGPPILIFSFLFAGLLFLFHPNRKNLLRLHPWFFLPLALVPLFLWGYFTQKQDGGILVQWMLDWYIFKRVNGSVLGQTGPPGMHFLFILVFFSPYFLFFPKAIGLLFTSLFKEKKENFVLGIWFVAGWFLYEFSPSKLPAYAVVAHVPLAIMIVKIMLDQQNVHQRPKPLTISIHYFLAFAISIGLSVAAFLLNLPSSFLISIVLVSAVQIGFHVATIRHIKTEKFIPLVLSSALFFQLAIWMVLLPQLDDFKDSTRKVSTYIAQNAKPKSEIIIANDTGSPPSLPFYLSLNFSEIKEEKDFFSIWNQYYYSTDPKVFILGQVHLDQFKQYKGKVVYKEFSSFFVDRKGKANYFVVINKAAQKQ